MADLPSLHHHLIPQWEQQILEAFQRVDNPVFPKSEMTILKSMNGDIFRFVRHLNKLMNPNLMEVPSTLIANHPKQEGTSISDFVQASKFYYHIQGLQRDHAEDFDKPANQDVFILNMDYGQKVLDTVTLEHNSANKNLSDRWEGNRFFLSIQGLIPKLINEGKIPKYSPSTSTKPKGRWSKYQLPTNSIKEEDIDFTNGASMFTYAVQGCDMDSFSEDHQSDQHISMLYKAANAIAKDLNKFDTTRNCAVCRGTGHAFTDCPELQGDLCDPYIKLRVQLNKF